MTIPNLKNMLIQDEMFFQRQGGETRDRGLKLVAIVRELAEEIREHPVSARDAYKIAEMKEALKKFGWKPEIIARELNVDPSTVHNRFNKYRSQLKTAAACLLLSVTCLLAGGCVCRKDHFRGTETVQLIGRADFRKAAGDNPEFVADCIRKINELEFNYYQSSQKHYQPPCRTCYKQRPDGEWVKRKPEPAIVKPLPSFPPGVPVPGSVGREPLPTPVP